MTTVTTWILNAVVYAIVFCLIWFNVVARSFEYYDLLSMGTMIYVGLVFALQLKIGFIHHLWNQVHVWSMVISIAGLFLFLLVLNNMTSVSYIDFYGIADDLYKDNLFWFFGFFSVPLMCFLIDFVWHSFEVVLFPSKEMTYREAAFGVAG
jgi:hypothetical protein